jgi:hypothetical protein
MRIFLSHQNRDKALVREFREFLPRFLDTWLDEDSLPWGVSLPEQLKATVQSSVDFLIVFLDRASLASSWVRQELEWALARERELGRIFVLPILLEEVPASDLPSGLGERLYLRLADFNRASVEALANRATIELFRLIVETLASVQLELPRHPSLGEVRDALTAGQAQLLGYLVLQSGQGPEILQRDIEAAMRNYSGPELFYRLETLIAQGFITKRRFSTDGQFSYRLTPEFAQSLK